MEDIEELRAKLGMWEIELETNENKCAYLAKECIKYLKDLIAKHTMIKQEK